MRYLTSAASSILRASTSYGASFSRTMTGSLHTSTIMQSQAGSEEETAFTVPNLVVFGGNGYVGSHVCQAAIRMGVPVVSVNRSGRPGNASTSWADQVDWVSGSASDPDTYKHLFQNCMGIVSCVGSFGSNETMLEINGRANVKIVETAAAAGVQRFAFISAHPYNFPGDLFLLKGYFQGKRMVEEALRLHLPNGGVYLQPGFIHGTRKWGSMDIPLGFIGNPMQRIVEALPNQSLATIPVAGAVFVPPVSAETVARAAVTAATDPSVPAGPMDVWAIAEYSDHD